MDDYREAAMRWLQDGDCLLRSNRFGGASHAFGLAAECAVKHAMDRLPGGERELPRRHLPDLIDDGKRWFSGRTQRGLYQLLNSTGYMEGWTIDNRYRGDDAFDVQMAERYRDHARRTCRAANLGA